MELFVLYLYFSLYFVLWTLKSDKKRFSLRVCFSLCCRWRLLQCSSSLLVAFDSCFPAAPGSAPGSQYGTMTRQISRHNSTTSSTSSGGYRRTPSVTAQFSAQPHVNGGPLYSQNSSKLVLSRRTQQWSSFWRKLF